MCAHTMHASNATEMSQYNAIERDTLTLTLPQGALEAAAGLSFPYALHEAAEQKKAVGPVNKSTLLRIGKLL